MVARVSPRLALALLPLAAGCVTLNPTLPPEAAAPEMRPERFFDGATRGAGTLQTFGSGQKIVRVESAGRPEADGAFRLDQTIRHESGRVERRTWQMRPTGPGTYAATLTDAEGPVDIRVEGNTMRLSYPIRRAFPRLTMAQTLVLAPDGRTVHNVGTVRGPLGLVVARLDETITRVGG